MGGKKNNTPPTTTPPTTNPPTTPPTPPASPNTGGTQYPGATPQSLPVVPYTEPNTTAEPTSTEPGPKNNSEPIKETDPGSFGPFNESPLGTYTWNTGGPVPGPRINKDIVPAMLTPGEFVMSKGAVNKFGLNVMMSMNKAGGGTNRPTYKGMLPGYQGGGPVDVLQSLRDELDRRGIKDLNTRAMYLAQFKEESGLTLGSELSYRNTAADQIRRSFYNARSLSDAEIDVLKKDDVAFFNHMYGDRLDNRGEGYKYRGRGYIQLTGRSNYRDIGNAIGVDLEANPDLLLDHDTALKASFEFMRSRVNESDLRSGNVRAVTRDINGGYNGLDHRIKYFNQFLVSEQQYLKELGQKQKRQEQGKGGNTSVRSSGNAPAPGNERAGFQGPPTPGALRNYRGISSFIPDLIFNIQTLGKQREMMRSMPAVPPPPPSPRRNAGPLQQFLQMLSPTPAPEPPEFIAPTITQPVGRRSPQQSGS